MNLGPTGLGIIFAIVMVTFGGSKLPPLATSPGVARRELEGASSPSRTEETL